MTYAPKLKLPQYHLHNPVFDDNLILNTSVKNPQKPEVRDSFTAQKSLILFLLHSMVYNLYHNRSLSIIQRVIKNASQERVTETYGPLDDFDPIKVVFLAVNSKTYSGLKIAY